MYDIIKHVYVYSIHRYLLCVCFNILIFILLLFFFHHICIISFIHTIRFFIKSRKKKTLMINKIMHPLSNVVLLARQRVWHVSAVHHTESKPKKSNLNQFFKSLFKANTANLNSFTSCFSS